jgi:hypothetical protein
LNGDAIAAVIFKFWVETSRVHRFARRLTLIQKPIAEIAELLGSPLEGAL